MGSPLRHNWWLIVIDFFFNSFSAFIWLSFPSPLSPKVELPGGLILQLAESAGDEHFEFIVNIFIFLCVAVVS